MAGGAEAVVEEGEPSIVPVAAALWEDRACKKRQIGRRLRGGGGKAGMGTGGGGWGEGGKEDARGGYVTLILLKTSRGLGLNDGPARATG